MTPMTVCLIDLGRDRFEMYAEPEEETVATPAHDDGWYRRWSHRAWVRWQALVDQARTGHPTTTVARWRDRAVCHLAETIAEQRTLWALRRESSVTLLFPSTLSREQARQSLERLLGKARWHHGVWLAIDTLLLLASAVLAPIPGPNVLAYYLAFRVVGHLQSWRGAQRGLAATTWTYASDPNLAELAALVNVPRAQRAPRLAEIAARLRLPHLPAYFERVVV